MDRTYADVTVLMDKSGSMANLVDDTIGGFNRLLDDQRKQPGKVTVTLAQFDTGYEIKINAQDAKFTRPLQRADYVPGGGTALLDAMARAIDETGRRLRDMPEEKRPALVTFVVITDGQENSSREHTKTEVRVLVERQQRDYAWHFVFLGANMDAIAEGGGIGILQTCAVNFAATPKGTQDAYNMVSDKIIAARCCAAGGQSVSYSFSEADRQKLAPDLAAGACAPSGGGAGSSS